MSWSLTGGDGGLFIPFESYRELLGRQTPTSLVNLGIARWKLKTRLGLMLSELGNLRGSLREKVTSL